MLISRTLAWGYLVEVILAGILYFVLSWKGFDLKLSKVLHEHWPMLSTIAGVLFAAGLAALIFFAQALDSPFGKYLGWLRADGHYLRVFKFQCLVFLIAAILPGFTELWQDPVIAHASWLLFIYACINGLTLVTNVVDIVRLRQKFLLEHDIATNPDNQPEI